MTFVIAKTEDSKKLKALKTVLKALDISFEEKKEDAYNETFLQKISEGEKAKKEGKGVPLNIDDLWK